MVKPKLINYIVTRVSEINSMEKKIIPFIYVDVRYIYQRQSSGSTLLYAFSREIVGTTSFCIHLGEFHSV